MSKDISESAPTGATISRRGLLGVGGAAAAAAAGGVVIGGAGEAAAQSGAMAPGLPYAALRIGDFEVFTLLDGAATVPEPQGAFGMNQTPETFAEVSEANFLPADQFRAYFTPTLVRGGGETILFDTGVGQGGLPARGNLPAALAGVGVAPEDVTVVVITHMHPDHIGGLMTDGAPTYPNARYVIGQVEYDFWAAQDPEANRVAGLFAANVAPMAEQATFVAGGDAVVSGVTVVEAYGHTPGHLNVLVESGGAQLHLIVDLANHYVWSLAYPDWEVRFDMDKDAAAATRRRMLDMIATDRIPFIGYHMPFPAVGYVERGSGDAEFRYVAASYQLSL